MLTAEGAATRARIIAGTAAQIRLHGAAATTLDDVRARTSASKSQIFHYFPGGKEELLLAVAEYEAEQVITDQEPHLSSLTTWDAWHAWRDAVVERYRNLGVHCPLGVLITELGRKTPAAQTLTAARRLFRTLRHQRRRDRHSQWGPGSRRWVARRRCGGRVGAVALWANPELLHVGAFGDPT